MYGVHNSVSVLLEDEVYRTGMCKFICVSIILIVLQVRSSKTEMSTVTVCYCWHFVKVM
jgi:hypothetical protein